jgi:branched-subunit amino acid ABC-type transport system permease component
MGPVAATLVSILSAAIFSVVTEFVIYRRISPTGTTPVMVASLGFSVMTQAVLSLLFGSGLKVSRLDELPINFTFINLFPREVLLILVLIFVSFGTWFLLFRTGFGVALRAISVDRNRTVLLKVPTGLIVSALFALAGALAGVAGVFVVISTGIHPYAGFKYMIMAFTACTVAGTGNLVGTVIAGILLGVLLTITEAYSSALASEGIALMILCLVLIFRPEGIFLKRSRWTC